MGLRPVPEQWICEKMDSLPLDRLLLVSLFVNPDRLRLLLVSLFVTPERLRLLLVSLFVTPDRLRLLLVKLFVTPDRLILLSLFGNPVRLVSIFAK